MHEYVHVQLTLFLSKFQRELEIHIERESVCVREKKDITYDTRDTMDLQ